MLPLALGNILESSTTNLEAGLRSGLRSVIIIIWIWSKGLFATNITDLKFAWNFKRFRPKNFVNRTIFSKVRTVSTIWEKIEKCMAICQRFCGYVFEKRRRIKKPLFEELRNLYLNQKVVNSLNYWAITYLTL